MPCPAQPIPSFEQQVAELRNYLLQFARPQLRNDTWAEDTVSETLLAALSKPHTFGNRSQLKTWLVGILKHKVLDSFRQHGREVRQPAKCDEPLMQARLFLMREWLERSSEEICKELQLTPTNLYVKLHRARLRLRQGLALSWYGNLDNLVGRDITVRESPIHVHPQNV